MEAGVVFPYHNPLDKHFAGWIVLRVMFCDAWVMSGRGISEGYSEARGKFNNIIEDPKTGTFEKGIAHAGKGMTYPMQATSKAALWYAAWHAGGGVSRLATQAKPVQVVLVYLKPVGTAAKPYLPLVTGTATASHATQLALHHEDPSFDDLLNVGFGAYGTYAAWKFSRPFAVASRAGATGPGAVLRSRLGTQFDEYIHFRNQSFTPAQSKYLTQPYGNRAGHHFPIPQRVGRGVLPGVIVDSPFNVLKPRGTGLGRFYELHYRVDPSFFGAGFPRSIGGSWSGRQLGLQKYSGFQRIWYATPGATKVAGGTGIVVGGAGSGCCCWSLDDDEE